VLVMESSDDVWIGSPVKNVAGLVARGIRVQAPR